MRLLFAAMFLALFAVPSVAVAQEPKAEEKDKVKIDPETKRAIDAALRFLAKEQNADGSWGNTAITGFVLLAFMSNGNLPNQGEYGKNVDRGVKFLLSCDSRGDGYIVGYKGGNMYCHGMATLALTQVYGMTGDEDVKKVTKKAIDLIIKTQNPEGGWRYDPSPTGADISVTIMQVMALHGAKDAGLNVPDKTIKDSLKYIERCRDGRTGGYKYQPYAVGGLRTHGRRRLRPPTRRRIRGRAHHQGRGVHGTGRGRPRPLLVRPLLRCPRAQPGWRRSVGTLLQENARPSSLSRFARLPGAGAATQRRVVRRPPRSRLRSRLSNRHRRADPQRPHALSPDLPAVEEINGVMR